MNEYATLLVESKGNREQDKEKIEKLRKETKGIASVTILNSDPKLDKVIADVSGASTAIRTNGTNVFMIEIKVDKNTNLESLAQKLREITGGNVAYSEPYEYTR
jgi:cell division protein FtsX